ncbi:MULTISPECIES: adenylate kinase [Acidiplasma]|jgi:adenylate kinase|uniref:Adenylate kinase n=2 Tax=Acidiplasma TaxID=507753 RepID=A0A0Q1B620_9ARCH|nr:MULTISPECIES: adenylate kinase [Acidiplasma]KJE49451.1 adenylate kinase [Acidiplasma sp. MBA-1]KPV46382.1 adenylate kinase [Acidiplasma aeolicum]KQB35514.1 adenylate kinase [Acidiplasma cupricumulans]KQB36735.1 adenylate kinase [Acidiplasma aeolicum]WMT54574.1 MAG: adenylate kinase [Acidiplasma sp.]
MRVIVSGIPGVGKSTVIDLVSQRSDYSVKNFGTIMFETARTMYQINNRDEMRKLDIKAQIELQRNAAIELGKMDNIIIDTHMSIKSPSGYLPGLPEWVLKELNISSYFLIEADPDKILTHRLNDPTRIRDNDTEKDIKEHQEINRYYAVAYSVYSGATVNFIYNPENHPEEAAENILRRL